MKLGNIISRAGAAILKNVVPGGGLIIDLVNGFLPEEKKLPVEATGEQIGRTISGLPADQQAQLLSKEIDVEIAEINSWTQIQGSLAEADKAGSSTRPEIALMMAKIIAFIVIAFASMWIVAIYQNHVSMIKALSESWPLMLTVLGTPTALLRAYFGMRSKEKKARYSAATGQPAQPNILADIVKAIKG